MSRPAVFSHANGLSRPRCTVAAFRRMSTYTPASGGMVAGDWVATKHLVIWRIKNSLAFYKAPHLHIKRLMTQSLAESSRARKFCRKSPKLFLIKVQTSVPTCLIFCCDNIWLILAAKVRRCADNFTSPRSQLNKACAEVIESGRDISMVKHHPQQLPFWEHSWENPCELRPAPLLVTC